jgi:hypothetical protein
MTDLIKTMAEIRAQLKEFWRHDLPQNNIPLSSKEEHAVALTALCVMEIFKSRGCDSDALREVQVKFYHTVLIPLEYKANYGA